MDRFYTDFSIEHRLWSLVGDSRNSARGQAGIKGIKLLPIDDEKQRKLNGLPVLFIYTEAEQPVSE